MKKLISPEELARDDRFERAEMMDRITDPRNATPESEKARRRNGRLTPDRPDAPDAARALMQKATTGAPVRSASAKLPASHCEWIVTCSSSASRWSCQYRKMALRVVEVGKRPTSASCVCLTVAV